MPWWNKVRKFVGITRTDQLIDQMLVQCEIARWGTERERTQALARVSQTLFNIARPKFDARRLRDAFNRSCVEPPAFGTPAVVEGELIHLDGGFNLTLLGHLYFIEAAVTIDGEKDAKAMD